jgi:hypothetical protein
VAHASRAQVISEDHSPRLPRARGSPATAKDRTRSDCCDTLRQVCLALGSPGATSGGLGHIRKPALNAGIRPAARRASKRPCCPGPPLRGLVREDDPGVLPALAGRPECSRRRSARSGRARCSFWTRHITRLLRVAPPTQRTARSRGRCEALLSGSKHRVFLSAISPVLGLMLGNRHIADLNQNIAEPHAAIIAPASGQNPSVDQSAPNSPYRTLTARRKIPVRGVIHATCSGTDRRSSRPDWACCSSR